MLISTSTIAFREFVSSFALGLHLHTLTCLECRLAPRTVGILHSPPPKTKKPNRGVVYMARIGRPGIPISIHYHYGALGVDGWDCATSLAALRLGMSVKS